MAESVFGCGSARGGIETNNTAAMQPAAQSAIWPAISAFAVSDARLKPQKLVSSKLWFMVWGRDRWSSLAASCVECRGKCWPKIQIFSRQREEIWIFGQHFPLYFGCRPRKKTGEPLKRVAFRGRYCSAHGML